MPEYAFVIDGYRRRPASYVHQSHSAVHLTFCQQGLSHGLGCEKQLLDFKSDSLEGDIYVAEVFLFTDIKVEVSRKAVAGNAHNVVFREPYLIPV